MPAIRSHWIVTIYLLSPTAVVAAPLELRDGDRVVLVGDTLIEREQAFGYLEVALTTRFPDRNVTFRNIGWSADSPAGDSRFGLSLLQAGLEPPNEGWRQLHKQLDALKPTVLIVGYGMADSFVGEAGLPKFVETMNRLLDAAQQSAGNEKLRVLILGPIAHLKLPPPLPDPAKHNAALAKYDTPPSESWQPSAAPRSSVSSHLPSGPIPRNSATTAST